MLTLFDVEAEKRQADVGRSARELAHAMVEAVREPVVLVDEEARIHAANLAFCETFGLEPAAFERTFAQRWHESVVRARALQ